ncbi:MAG TPA: twin-arginine translocase TatA/TatE family subunit [Bacillota bacterium]|nr:twin-arginine translocase TatA/TatE family subunit [Bacillota bacterium]
MPPRRNRPATRRQGVANTVGDLLSPTHLIIVLIIALLVFGPRRLPELGGSIGKTIREFQRSMKEVSQPEPDVKSEAAQAQAAHSTGTDAGKS